MLKKKHSILISILILIIGLMFFKTKFNTKKHYVTVNNIINKVYTCKDGYNEEMKDIVSEEAFFKANSYRFYDNPNFKRPISIDIKINEFNQKKLIIRYLYILNMISLYMIEIIRKYVVY